MTCPTNSVTIDATTNRVTGSGYSYDANGNMTSDGTNTLTYDAENRLLTSSGGGGSGTYSYDGRSLRVKKVSSSTTTVYIFSGTKVIAEYVNGAAVGSPTREYVYSGSQLIAKIEGGVTNYYHSDHLSARVTTDSTGALAGQQGHFPFGESWYSANTTTKFQFTSYERDAESGNDYAMMRYDVSRLGRFSSPDPLGGHISNPQSLNRYAYVLNNPVSHVDPLGLDCYETKDGLVCDDGGSGSSGSNPTIGPGFGPGFCDASRQSCSGCQIENQPAPCGLVGRLLSSGSAAQCPNNDCNGITYKGDTFYRNVWTTQWEVHNETTCYSTSEEGGYSYCWDHIVGTLTGAHALSPLGPAGDFSAGTLQDAGQLPPWAPLARYLRGAARPPGPPSGPPAPRFVNTPVKQIPVEQPWEEMTTFEKFIFLSGEAAEIFDSLEVLLPIMVPIRQQCDGINPCGPA